MKRLRLVAVVSALLAIIAVPVIAGGLWFGLPIVGGNAYCNTYTAGVPGTTAVCGAQAPAGPVATGTGSGLSASGTGALTGNELIPADLNPQGGNNTYPAPGTASSGQQSGYIPSPLAASGSYFLTTNQGLAALTSLIPNSINNVLLNATATVTNWAIQLPATPVDGQLVRIAANATLTNVQFETGSLGQSIDTQTRALSMYPLGFAASNGTATGVFGATYLWTSPTNAWRRIQ